MSMPPRPYLTEGAHKVFAFAHNLADEMGHDDVTPVHFALGLVRARLVAATALFNLGVPLDTLEREFEEHLPPPGTPRTPALNLTRFGGHLNSPVMLGREVVHDEGEES